MSDESKEPKENPRSQRRDFFEDYMNRGRQVEPTYPSQDYSDYSPSHPMWNTGLPPDPRYDPNSRNDYGYPSFGLDDPERDPTAPIYGNPTYETPYPPYPPYETPGYVTLGPEDVPRIRAEELSKHQRKLSLVLDDISSMRRNLRTMTSAEVVDMCLYYARKLARHRDGILRVGGTVEDQRYDAMLQWVQDIPSFMDGMNKLLDDVARFRVVSKTMPKAFLIVRCSYYADTMIALKDKLLTRGVVFHDPRFDALFQWAAGILDAGGTRRSTGGVLKKRRTQLRF